MRVSAKTEYACIALLELAARFGTDKPVRVRKIAQDNGIPSRFLIQILLQLKGAGLVGSVRGAAGGYRLRQPPAEISLAAVVQVIEGRQDLASSAGVQSPAVSVLMDVWRDVQRHEREMLEATTLADLLHRIWQQGEPMYYI